MINKIIKKIVEVVFFMFGIVTKNVWYCMLILSGVGIINIVSSVCVELLLLVSLIIVLVIMRRMLSRVLVASVVEEVRERLVKVTRDIKEGIGLLEAKEYIIGSSKVNLSVQALIFMFPVTIVTIIKTVATGTWGIIMPVLAMFGGAAVAGVGLAWLTGIGASALTGSSVTSSLVGILGKYGVFSQMGNLLFGIVSFWWGARTLYRRWRGPGKPGPTGGTNSTEQRPRGENESSGAEDNQPRGGNNSTAGTQPREEREDTQPREESESSGAEENKPQKGTLSDKLGVLYKKVESLGVEMKSEKDDLQRKIDSLQKENNKLREELQAANKEKEDLKLQLQAAKKEVDSLKAENNNQPIGGSESSVADEKEELREQLLAERDKNKDLIEDKKDLEQQWQWEIDANEALKEQLEAANEANEVLRKQLLKLGFSILE